ncbi:MAG TPA: HGGxSTG domain-containing protein [Dongiaceae bacterium]
MPAARKAATPRTGSRNSRSDEPPRDPPREASLAQRVAGRLSLLAAEAGCADLAEGAGNPDLAGETMRQFMAQQLAAGHLLTMGFTARAGRLLGDCDKGDEIARNRRALEIMRFAHGTARMMERCRSAALALERMGHPEPPEEAPDPSGPGDGPGGGDGEVMRIARTRGLSWHEVRTRDLERRRILDWIAQGNKLTEMPQVTDWPNYGGSGPPMPDIEKLDKRLLPPAPQQSADAAPRQQAASGLRRGRLKNGNPVGDYMTAPRCGARTRAGCACRQPAMRNGRCRFHGGKSTGATTAEGRHRARTARLAHGFRSAEIIDLRAAAARIGRNLRALTAAAMGGLTTKPQRARSDRGSGTLSFVGAKEVAREDAKARRDRGSGALTITDPDHWTPGAALGRAEEPHESGTTAGQVARPLRAFAPPRANSSGGKSDAAPAQRHGGFVPFVTLWCNTSSVDRRPAGHGVDRSDLARRGRNGPARRG